MLMICCSFPIVTSSHNTTMISSDRLLQDFWGTTILIIKLDFFLFIKVEKKWDVMLFTRQKNTHMCMSPPFLTTIILYFIVNNNFTQMKLEEKKTNYLLPLDGQKKLCIIIADLFIIYNQVIFYNLYLLY